MRTMTRFLTSAGLAMAVMAGGLATAPMAHADWHGHHGGWHHGGYYHGGYHHYHGYYHGGGGWSPGAAAVVGGLIGLGVGAAVVAASPPPVYYAPPPPVYYAPPPPAYYAPPTYYFNGG